MIKNTIITLKMLKTLHHRKAPADCLSRQQNQSKHTAQSTHKNLKRLKNTQ